MTTIPGWYTSPEIRDLFNWSRQQVAATARREKWGRQAVGRAYLYRALDVDAFWTARERTRLAKLLGWKRQGLIRHDEYDEACPTCDGFAVSLSEDILCSNGHRIEGDS